MINNSVRFLSTGRTLVNSIAPAVPVRQKLADIRNTIINQVSTWIDGLRRFLGWKVTIIALEAGLILGGALVSGIFGWLALARYSSFLMVIGAFVMLIGIARSYGNMMLVTPSEAAFGKNEKTYLSVPMATEMMAARYAAFMQMIFWIACGILPILAGALIQSFL